MSQAMVVHGVVARVIDVPSQGNTYLRIEVPIEFHAELTRLFYGKRVLVMAASDTLKDQPYGMVQLDAEPAPAPPPKAVIRPAERAHEPGGSLAKSAAMLCDEPAFQRFMWSRENGDEPLPDDFGSTDAAYAVRERCGIASRAALDHNSAAAQAFQTLMRNYRDWLSVHGTPGEQFVHAS